MKLNVDYSLYLITNRTIMTAKTVEESVEQAIMGGCTLVQLREKTISSRQFYETALKVHNVTRKYNVPLIINDRTDIALAVDAEGIHLGQKDMPVAEARKILGSNKIIGVSAGTLEEACLAQKAGADYIGVGAMYSTPTKNDAQITTMDELHKIRAAVSLPIVVIGGINKNTLPDFAGSRIDGAAIVSAILSHTDIEQAAKEMKHLLALYPFNSI